MLGLLSRCLALLLTITLPATHLTSFIPGPATIRPPIKDVRNVHERQALASASAWFNIGQRTHKASVKIGRLYRQGIGNAAGRLTLDAVGVGLFVGFAAWWTELTRDMAAAGRWGALTTLEVTALVSAAISNVLSQLVHPDEKATPGTFDWRHLARQLLGVAFIYAVYEGLYIYYLYVPQIPSVGPAPSWVVKTSFDALLLTLLFLNRQNLYGAARLWSKANHWGGIQNVRRQAPAFSMPIFFIDLVATAIAFGFFGDRPVVTYVCFNVRDVVYVLLLSLHSKKSQASPETSSPHAVDRVLEWFHARPWISIDTPLSKVALWTGAVVYLASGYSPPATFWLAAMLAMPFISWLWTQMAQRQLERAAGRLKKLVQEQITFKAQGESSMSLIVRLRVPIEEEWRRVIFWLNRTGTPDPLGLYRKTIAFVLDVSLDALHPAFLLNTEFPRVASKLSEHIKTKRSRHLFSNLAVGLKPPSHIPEVYEHNPTGILMRARFWRFWGHHLPLVTPNPPVRSPDTTFTLRTADGKDVVLTVKPLKSENIPSLQNWTSALPRFEADDDLDQVTLSGKLGPGTYGYRLTRMEGGTEVTEGFVYLFAIKGHYHVHIIYANPQRPSSRRIRGIGRALMRLAMEDAIHNNLHLTIFPTTAEAASLVESLKFSRMTVAGQMMSEMWSASPEEMRKTLGDTTVRQLPPADTYLRIPVPQEDERFLEFNDTEPPYTRAPFVLLSRKLYERCLDHPSALLEIVGQNNEAYFSRQKNDPQNTYLLDVSTDGRIEIIDARTYIASLSKTRTRPELPFSPHPSLLPDDAVHYRQATLRDWEALKTFRHTHWVGRTYANTRKAPEALVRLILQGKWPGVIQIAIDSQDGKILGYAMAYVHPEKHYAEIEEGAVQPDMQRYDIGDHLFRQCRDVAMAQLQRLTPPGIPYFVFLQEYSALTAMAKIGRRQDFKQDPHVPSLWLYSRNGDRPTASAIRWQRGFPHQDPRKFPSSLVDPLLQEAKRSGSLKEIRQTAEYILHYRMESGRAWWEWAMSWIRPILKRYFHALTTGMLLFLMLAPLSAQTTYQAWAGGLAYGMGDRTYKESTVAPEGRFSLAKGKFSLDSLGRIYLGKLYEDGKASPVLLPQTEVQTRWKETLSLKFARTWTGESRPTSVEPAITLKPFTWKPLKELVLTPSILLSRFHHTEKEKKELFAMPRIGASFGPVEATLGLARAERRYQIQEKQNYWRLDTLTTLGKNRFWFVWAAAPFDYIDRTSTLFDYGDIWFAYTRQMRGIQVGFVTGRSSLPGTFLPGEELKRYKFFGLILYGGKEWVRPTKNVQPVKRSA